MIRTQVQLTEEQARQLKRLAAERGVSMASLIRECVDLALERADAASRRARAAALIGGFHSGLHDVSERHDEYLADAYAE